MCGTGTVTAGTGLEAKELFAGFVFPSRDRKGAGIKSADLGVNATVTRSLTVAARIGELFPCETRCPG